MKKSKFKNLLRNIGTKNTVGVCPLCNKPLEGRGAISDLHYSMTDIRFGIDVSFRKFVCLPCSTIISDKLEKAVEETRI
jgi:hypothetical protein